MKLNRVYASWVGAIVLGSLSVSAHAGEWSSGGGNALICFDSPAVPALIRRLRGQIPDEAISRIRSIEAYDLYEAQLPRGMAGIAPDVIPMEAGESPMGYVQRILSRFDLLFPEVSTAVRESIQAFRAETNMVNQQHGVEPVTDVNPMGLIDRRNCVLGTMAVQARTANQSLLQVDVRLFNHRRHSAHSKAVLLLHEFVYRLAIMNGQQDSRLTRVLVGKMITRGLSLGEIKQAVRDLGFFGQGYPRALLRQIFTDVESVTREKAQLFMRNNEHQIQEIIRRMAMHINEASAVRAVRCIFDAPQESIATRTCLEFDHPNTVAARQILEPLIGLVQGFRRELLAEITTRIDQTWLPLIRSIPAVSEVFKERYASDIRRVILDSRGAYLAVSPYRLQEYMWERDWRMAPSTQAMDFERSTNPLEEPEAIAQ